LLLAIASLLSANASSVRAIASCIDAPILISFGSGALPLLRL
jgi:hypothetical protein